MLLGNGAISSSALETPVNHIERIVMADIQALKHLALGRSFSEKRFSTRSLPSARYYIEYSGERLLGLFIQRSPVTRTFQVPA
jgi:hypothetical protein